MRNGERTNCKMITTFFFLSFLCSVVFGQGSSFFNASVDNLRLTNEFRVQQGLPALSRDSKLESLAMQWSQHMFEVKNMYHSDYGMAENVATASGMYSPETVSQGFFSQWENSPGHRANMVGSSHQCGGVGIYGDGTTFYGTQLFLSNCVPSTNSPPTAASAIPSPSPVPSPSPFPSSAPETTQVPTYPEQTEYTVSPTVMFTLKPLPMTQSGLEAVPSQSGGPYNGPDVTLSPSFSPRQQKRLLRFERLISKLARLEKKFVTCLLSATLKKRQSRRCEKIKSRVKKVTEKIQNLEQKLGSLAI